MSTSLTVVDNVDLLDGKLGILAQALQVRLQMLVFFGIELLEFVKHGPDELDVQVFEDDDKGNRQDEQVNRENIPAPLNGHHQDIDCRCTKDNPEDSALDIIFDIQIKVHLSESMSLIHIKSLGEFPPQLKCFRGEKIYEQKDQTL